MIRVDDVRGSSVAAELRSIRDRYTDEEIAGFYAQGLWKPQSFYGLVREQAENRADSVFLFDDTTTLTYRELADRALRLAVGLKRAGLGRGDRIAVQLPNWTEAAPVAVAISRIGAVLVPIMPIYRQDEVEYILAHSGATMAITCQEFHRFEHARMFADLREQVPALDQVFVVRPGDDLDPAIGRPLGELLVTGDHASLEAEAGPDSSPEDGFAIIYTSGTTSRPKGCFHTFNAVRGSSTITAQAFGCGPDDVVFGPSPVSHSTGMTNSLVVPLLVGAKSYLMEKWSPLEGLQKIQEHGCTISINAAAFLQMIMDAYDPSIHDASSLRVWGCAGAPIPASVVTRARELFVGCKVLSLYGRSENFFTTVCTLDDPEERSITSDGSASNGSIVKIVDKFGVEVPRGEEGDIANWGPWHMIEYFRDDEATAALFTDEGLSRSGDLGRMDEDGYVRVTGRLKDIVIRGGMNISAAELEDHLLRHASISQVAIVGMPDERLGEKVCAYVVPVDPEVVLTLEDIADFLRDQNVATPKLPERLEVVDRLPMTATGKTQKHILRTDIADKLRAASANR